MVNTGGGGRRSEGRADSVEDSILLIVILYVSNCCMLSEVSSGSELSEL